MKVRPKGGQLDETEARHGMCPAPGRSANSGCGTWSLIKTLHSPKFGTRLPGWSWQLVNVFQLGLVCRDGRGNWLTSSSWVSSAGMVVATG
ncbi:hypothetical protein RRG08_026645 [Elysia crispata]|uniref:Uncharacterized protein n=1 Tax=Elysia crispata TaxID=231223 RepID=A0AAE1AYH1_9GAST|nr:hypothetical protein RRG08_026645 [Elysia crispata]